MLKFEKITAENITIEDRAEIQSFLSKNLSTVFHQLDFNELVKSSFGTGLYYLIGRKNKQIAVLIPIHTYQGPLISKIHYSSLMLHSIPYGGAVYDRAIIGFEELYESIDIPAVDKLEYWTIPDINNEYLLESKKPLRFFTNLIDLSVSEDEILNSVISRDTRYYIRWGLKRDFIVEAATGSSLDEAFDLFDNMYSKEELESLPQNFLRSVYDHFSKSNQAHILVTKLSNKVISAIFLIGNHDFMHIWMAARDYEVPKNIYPTEVLWWEAIRKSKEVGSKYFDLCYLYSDKQKEDTTGKQFKIASFKLGFSQQVYPFYCFSKKQFPNQIINKLSKHLK